MRVNAANGVGDESELAEGVLVHDTAEIEPNVTLGRGRASGATSTSARAQR